MISLKLTFPKLDEIFKLHEKDVMGVLAASMQTNRAMMFDKDGADNGKKKWKKPIFRNGRPLQNTGALRKSMAPTNNGKTPAHAANAILRLSGPTVMIGTNLIYAKLMNDGTVNMPGGVLKAVNAQALKIPLPSGQSATPAAKKARKGAVNIKDEYGNKEKVMFRRSVKIPARKMDILTKADENEFSMTMANYIAEVLSRG